MQKMQSLPDHDQTLSDQIQTYTHKEKSKGRSELASVSSFGDSPKIDIKENHKALLRTENVTQLNSNDISAARKDEINLKMSKNYSLMQDTKFEDQLETGRF